MWKSLVFTINLIEMYLHKYGFENFGIPKNLKILLCTTQKHENFTSIIHTYIHIHIKHTFGLFLSPFRWPFLSPFIMDHESYTYIHTYIQIVCAVNLNSTRVPSSNLRFQKLSATPTEVFFCSTYIQRIYYIYYICAYVEVKLGH